MKVVKVESVAVVSSQMKGNDVLSINCGIKTPLLLLRPHKQ